MAKAILRIAKLKTFGNIGSSGAHVERSRDTPNADAARTHLNEVLVGSGFVMDDVKSALPEKYRKNAVLAVENLLTASPDFFRGLDDAAIKKWADESVRSMQKFWGKDNVVSATLHLDEETPHIHLFAIPKMENKHGDMALNCREFIGTRGKLRDMQTHYADSMKQFGLERGIEGSTRKHVPMKKLRGEADSILQPRVHNLDVIVKEKTVLGKRVVIESINDDIVRAKDAKELREIAHSHVLDRDINKQAKHNLSSLRSQDLLEVAHKLGYEKSDKEKNVYYTQAGKIAITGQKFYDFSNGKGGGGAIDFVMHTEDCDFNRACSILGDVIGIEAASTEIVLHSQSTAKKLASKPVALVKPNVSTDPSHKQGLIDYLHKQRCISMPTISKWINKGWVYASKFADTWQAVFTGENGYFRKNPATDFSGWVRGSEAEPKVYIEADSIAICESHIDAMSLHDKRPDLGICFVNGKGGAELGIREVLRRGKKPVLALDNESGTIEQMEALAKKYECGVLLSDYKDWNDDLTHAVDNGIHEPYEYNPYAPKP